MRPDCTHRESCISVLLTLRKKPTAARCRGISRLFGAIGHNIHRSVAFRLLAAGLLANLSGCANPYDPVERAVGGGLLGAGAGAAIGAAAGGGPGAALGAAIGGATGVVGGAATTPPPPGYYGYPGSYYGYPSWGYPGWGYRGLPYGYPGYAYSYRYAYPGYYP